MPRGRKHPGDPAFPTPRHGPSKMDIHMALPSMLPRDKTDLASFGLSPTMLVALGLRRAFAKLPS